MDGTTSYGTSWADQWDPESEYPTYDTKKRSGGGGGGGGGVGGKYGKKVGEGFGKTKAVASSGMKKVKQTTSVGIQWIKEKYHKTTNKP